MPDTTRFSRLAAHGAKLALWKLYRAGYRIVNFIHDEALVEVPADSDLKEHAEAISRLMIDGMQAVVPNIAIKVEYAAADRWYKNAKAVYNEQGELLPWTPDPSREELHQQLDSAPPIEGVLHETAMCPGLRCVGLISGGKDGPWRTRFGT